MLCGVKSKIRIISVILGFVMVFTQVFTYRVSADTTVSKATLSLNKTVTDPNGVQQTTVTGKAGDEFTINYSINPSNISASTNSEPKKKEIILVIDTSRSMEYGLDGNQSDLSRLDIVKSAAKSFIAKFKDDKHVKIGLVEYSDKAYLQVNQNSSNSFKKVVNAINDASGSGGTNTGDGLRCAYNMLHDSDNASQKYIVLLTDGLANVCSYDRRTNEMLGVDNNSSYYTKWVDNNDYTGIGLNYAQLIAGEIKSGDKIVNSYMIGFTKDTSGNQLEQIASSANGIYMQANDDTALNDVYNRIANKIQSDYSVNNIHFEETFPEGVDIISVPNGLQVSGQSVKTVSGNLNDINYTLNSSQKLYSAVKNSFSIRVRTNSPSTYSISESSFITYNDLDGSSETKDFSPVTITVNSSTTINQAPITLSRTVEKSQYTLNNSTTDDIKVAYTITPSSIDKSKIDQSLVAKPKEIVIVVDTSGSMAWDLSGNKINSKNSVKSRLDILKSTLVATDGSNSGFIDKFVGKDNVSIALVPYNTISNNPSTLVNMSNSSSVVSLKNSVSSLTANGGTNIGDGLRRAYWILKNSTNTSAEKYIVLMTDGYPTAFSYDSVSHDWWGDIDSIDFKFSDGKAQNYYANSGENDFGGYSLLYSNNMAERISLDSLKINSYVVGFSRGINSSKLQQISGKLNGSYEEAQTAGDLQDVYSEIAEQINMDLPISQVILNETYPDGITPIGVFKGSTICEGFTIGNHSISGNLDSIGNLSYKLNSDGTAYRAQTITFDVILRGSKIGQYTLGGEGSEGKYNSTLTYTDINKSTNEKEFPDTDLKIVSGLSPIIKQGIFENNNSASDPQDYLQISNNDGSVNLANKAYYELGVLVNTNHTNSSVKISIDTGNTGAVDLNDVVVTVYKVNSDGSLSSNTDESYSILKIDGSINLTLPGVSEYIIAYSLVPNLTSLEDGNDIINTVTVDSFSSDLTLKIINVPNVG